jgi:hypothetical protein
MDVYDVPVEWHWYDTLVVGLIFIFFVLGVATTGCSLKGQIVLNTGEDLRTGITEATTTDAETKAMLTE